MKYPVVYSIMKLKFISIVYISLSTTFLYTKILLLVSTDGEVKPCFIEFIFNLPFLAVIYEEHENWFRDIDECVVCVLGIFL